MAKLNLKVKDKLLLGNIGQLVFISLLVLFIYTINRSLNKLTQKRLQNNQELNEVKDFTLLIRDYFSNSIEYDELKEEYGKISAHEYEIIDKAKIEAGWNNIEEVKALRDSNMAIINNVMDITSFTITQSNEYLNTVLRRLNSTEQRDNVTRFERAVIGSANTNIHNNYRLQVLFKKLKDDISTKDSLYSFLKKSTEQIELDKWRLEGTRYIELVSNALETNKKIVKYTNRYAANVEELQKLDEEISGLTNDLFEIIEKSDNEITTASFVNIKRTIRNIFVILIFISVFLIVLNYTTGNLISRVLRQLSFDLVRISEGNLSAASTKGYEKRQDEVGELARAVNILVKRLHDIIGSIIKGSGNVADASNQISATSQQLSQGASEQASSVEEISSSMEEMVANIQHNSDNARETEKISNVAYEGVEKVKVAASDSVTSIREIAEKITIINDIAFQTNILALNAAVEAARAGDHGKGFAVVAAEVRKLAERSKVAADEIDVLSKSSVQVTEDAGNLMENIVPEIQRTAGLVQEIAAASSEQNAGAEQINNAILHFNQITQQNASASEELATSAEELSAQAEHLKRTISYFKLNSERAIEEKPGQKPPKPSEKEVSADPPAATTREVDHSIIQTTSEGDDDFEKF